MSSLTGGAALLGLHQAFAFFASSVLQVAAARYFGPEVYGVFAVVNSLLALLLFTALTGVPHAVASFTAAEPEHARSVVRSGLALQLALGVVLGAALFLLAEPLARAFGDPFFTGMLRWAALALPLTGAAYVWIFALNGLHRFGRQSAALVLLTGTKVAAVIIVLALGGGAHTAMQAIVVASAFAALGAAGLARGIPGSRPFRPGRLASTGLQLGATYVAVAVWDQSDLMLMRALGSDAAHAGFLAAASAVAAAPGSLLAPLATALFPAVSRAAASGNLSALRASVSDAVDFAYRALVPVTAFGIVFGADIAELLFGTDYRGAGPAVAALLAGALAYALYEILDTVLRSGGRARLSWRLAAAALVAHVALSVVLIPRFGLDGAAWTRLLSSFLALFLVAVPAARWLGLRPRIVTILRPLVAASVAFAPFAVHDPGGEIAELFSGGIGFVLYLGMMWLLRGIRPDDVWRVQEIVATFAALQRPGGRGGR